MTPSNDSYVAEYLNSEEKLHLELPLCLHAEGRYAEALEAYARVDESLLSSHALEIKQADEILVRVKIGEKLDLSLRPSFRSAVAESIFEYARFTWAFWVDHRVAWSSLWRMLQISMAPSRGLRGQFWCTVFLMGHLMAISGKAKSGFFIAKHAYRRCLRHFSKPSSKDEKINRNCGEIVLAAFPYTHVVAGRLGKKFNESL